MRTIDFETSEANRLNQFQDIWDDQLHQAFENLAPYYDRANSMASLGLWDRWRKLFVNSMNIPESGKLLDLCAGTNSLGLEMLNKFPSLDITAIDYSQEMQLTGKKRAEHRGVRINSVVNDIHNLPFKDNTFDTVTIEAATRHLIIKKAFSEVLRVLKPGGTFYHCDLLRPKNKFIEKSYYAYLKFAIGLTGLFFSSNSAVWNCKSYFIEAIQMFYYPDDFSHMLNNIGFIDVKHKDILTGLVCFHEAYKPL